MAKRETSGFYWIGRVENDSRSNRRGKYCVIQGETANNQRHIEWRPVKFLKKSKWYAIRVGPTERNTRRTNTVAHPIREFKSKGEAIKYLEQNVDFSDTY